MTSRKNARVELLFYSLNRPLCFAVAVVVCLKVPNYLGKHSSVRKHELELTRNITDSNKTTVC